MHSLSQAGLHSKTWSQKRKKKKANKQSKVVHAYNTRTTRGSRVKVSLSYVVQSEPGLSDPISKIII